VSREPQQEPGTVIAAQPAIAAERPSSPFLSALSTYDPVYFALGTRGETNAKFQLSFKFQFFAQDAPLVRYANFLQDIYFGYTQTTIWNIGSASAPFYDTSYQPRVFYLNEDAWDWPGRKVMLGVESGRGHESNGKSGADSRSMNIAQLNVGPEVTITPDSDGRVRGAAIYLQDSENPDIADYRGYVDLKVILGKEDSWQIQGLFRKGSQGFSTQIDLSYPLRAVALGNLNGYFLVQYFDGYGESILDYNRRLPSQLRLGLMVVR
jgi:outer membrane phospholipase A